MVRDNDLEQSTTDRESADLQQSPEIQRRSPERGASVPVDGEYYGFFEPDQVEEPGGLLGLDWEESPPLAGSPSTHESEVDDVSVVQGHRAESPGAGRKRKREDREGEDEEVELADEDVIDEDVELQEQVTAVLAEHNDAGQDQTDQDIGRTNSPPIFQRVASPPAVHSGTDSAQTILTPAPAPPTKSGRQPRKVARAPKPAKKRMTRSQAKKTGQHPREAVKQPKSPNARLDDLDPKKKWCTCRCAEKTALRQGKRRMIACDAVPRCRVLWFHKKCVGLAEEDGDEEEMWYCRTHAVESGESGE